MPAGKTAKAGVKVLQGDVLGGVLVTGTGVTDLIVGANDISNGLQKIGYSIFSEDSFTDKRIKPQDIRDDQSDSIVLHNYHTDILASSLKKVGLDEETIILVKYLSDAGKPLVKDIVSGFNLTYYVSDKLGSVKNVFSGNTQLVQTEMNVVGDTLQLLTQNENNIQKSSVEEIKVQQSALKTSPLVEVPKVSNQVTTTTKKNLELHKTISERPKGYYRQLQEDKIVKNLKNGSGIDYENHVFNPEVKNRGKVVGGHIKGENIRIDKILGVDKNGVTKAHVSIYDKETGKWIPKRTDKGNLIENTFFPDKFSKNRIIYESEMAYKSAEKINNGIMWKGTSPSGIKLRGYTGPNVTVYPVYEE